MSNQQKDVTLSQSPAGTQSKRAKTRLTSRGKTRTLSSSSLDENASFAFSFDLSVRILLQDRPCCPQVSGAFRRLLASVLESGDLLGFIDDCSHLRSRLIEACRWDTSLSKGTSRRWVRGVAIAIQHAIPPSLIVHPSAWFDRVITFLGWMKRLPVRIRPTAEAVDSYLECDRRISSINLDENVYVQQLRRIWFEWFSQFRITDPFLPRHGSGSTADAGRVRHEKWLSLTTDAAGRICIKTPDLKWAHDLRLGDASRISKVVFVPKQAGKDRAICMEPAWLQYLQQGVAEQLIAYTHRGTCGLHKFVDIFSQERNRELCAHAFYERLATIDLSDASDSVSWDLIGRLTKGMPLYAYLLGTRSTHTIIDGRCLPMSKFAPMGSALCFPIECYVFTSVVELAFRMHYGRASLGYHSGIQVYGDDIIVPQEIYQLVVDILQSLGFIVNIQKSYSSGCYYESCGVEYLLGAKINVIKHPRAHLICHDVSTPEQVGMVTDLANSLYACGYLDARRFLLKYYEDKRIVIGRKQVGFMDLMVFDGKHCFPTQDPYIASRFDRDIQARVYTHWSCVTLPRRAPSDFQQWKSRNVPRTREQRKQDLCRGFVEVPVQDYFSRKAVVYLSKFGFLDLLKGDEIEAIGSETTGRLRQRLVRKVETLV